VAVVPQLYCLISPASLARAHRNLYAEGKITSGRVGACSCTGNCSCSRVGSMSDGIRKW